MCRRCSTWFSPNRLDYFEIACASRSEVRTANWLGTPSLHFTSVRTLHLNLKHFIFSVFSWGHPLSTTATASSSSARSISGILLRSIFHVQHWSDRRERCHRRWHNKHAIYFMPGIQVPPQSVKAKEEPNPNPDPILLWTHLDRLALARPVVCDNGMMVWWCMPSIHNNSEGLKRGKGEGHRLNPKFWVPKRECSWRFRLGFPKEFPVVIKIEVIY